MSGVLAALTAGIIAFAATNIDDIIILLLFFSQVDNKVRPQHIVFGQYLGFLMLIIASLPGFFGGLVVSRELIGLLGILPIIIGIKQLLNREADSQEVQTVTSNLKDSLAQKPIISSLVNILNPQIYKVAAVTIANGGDNISIYIPLFAGNTLANILIIISTFFLMVGVWCTVAYLLTRQPMIAEILSRYGNAAVPFILIALGLFIMYERGTFSLLWQG